MGNMNGLTFPWLKLLIVKSLPGVFLAYVSCFLYRSEWPQFIVSYRWRAYFEIRYHSVSGFRQPVCSTCSYIPLSLTCEGVFLYVLSSQPLEIKTWDVGRGVLDVSAVTTKSYRVFFFLFEGTPNTQTHKSKVLPLLLQFYVYVYFFWGGGETAVGGI